MKRLSLSSLLLTASMLMTTHTSQAAPSLPACPNSPNCVSTQANSSDNEHYLAPFKLTAEPAAAWQGLQAALLAQPRTIITDKTASRLTAEATSLIFRFVDDIEAILDAEAKVIQIRSASRTGHSDFGVNRKRLESLRQALQNQHLVE